MQKGTIFKHRETGKSACWLLPYEEGQLSADKDHLFRVRSVEDLPDFDFELSDLHIPTFIYKEQGKQGLYSYLRAFFSGYDNALKDQGDFWLFVFKSGFPDTKQALDRLEGAKK